MQFLYTILLLCVAAPAVAQSWPLRGKGDDLVGKVITVKAVAADTLSDIARKHDIGYDAIRQANPHVDPWLPGEGTRVNIPDRHILPKAPRDGIVLNLPEFRLYYFPPPDRDGQRQVEIYPVGIGRLTAPTPTGKALVVAHIANPAWYPPASIREEHAAENKPLPAEVPAGPNNPLGDYALKLSLPGYFIHGTDMPYGVGMRVSHGCIRLYPEDISRLFKAVPLNTPVHIVDQPYKAGWYKGKLYLEARPPLAGTGISHSNLTPAISVVLAAMKGRKVSVDWDKVTRVAAAARGIPVVVSR